MIEYKNTGYYVTECGEIIGKRGWVLKPSTTSGYKEVKICENGEISYKGVHQLVAECYIPNPDNKPVVNHKDGNKLNCHRDNLEWSTYLENSTHAVQTGLQKTGVDHYNAELTESEVHAICKLLQNGLPVKQVFYELLDAGIIVYPTKITDIKRHQCWKEISSQYNW